VIPQCPAVDPAALLAGQEVHRAVLREALKLPDREHFRVADPEELQVVNQVVLRVEVQSVREAVRWRRRWAPQAYLTVCRGAQGSATL